MKCLIKLDFGHGDIGYWNKTYSGWSKFRSAGTRYTQEEAVIVIERLGWGAWEQL